MRIVVTDWLMYVEETEGAEIKVQAREVGLRLTSPFFPVSLSHVLTGRDGEELV